MCEFSDRNMEDFATGWIDSSFTDGLQRSKLSHWRQFCALHQLELKYAATSVDGNGLISLRRHTSCQGIESGTPSHQVAVVAAHKPESTGHIDASKPVNEREPYPTLSSASSERKKRQLRFIRCSPETWFGSFCFDQLVRCRKPKGAIGFQVDAGQAGREHQGCCKVPLARGLGMSLSWTTHSTVLFGSPSAMNKGVPRTRLPRFEEKQTFWMRKAKASF